MSTLRPNICVFCGSRTGTKDSYSALAESLGTGLAHAGFGLVYGGGDMGLMGLTARAAKAAGGHVTGIIPHYLQDREGNTDDIDTLIITESMHERKTLMFEKSQAFVALPGGPGTLEELMEALTWHQLGLHDRPIVLVDAEDYWAPFLRLLDHLSEQGFCDPEFRNTAILAESSDAAVEALTEIFPT